MKATDKYIISEFEYDIYNNWLSKMNWEDNEYSYKCFLLDVFNLNGCYKKLNAFTISKFPNNKNKYYGLNSGQHNRVMYIISDGVEIFLNFKTNLIKLNNIINGSDK